MRYIYGLLLTLTLFVLIWLGTHSTSRFIPNQTDDLNQVVQDDTSNHSSQTADTLNEYLQQYKDELKIPFKLKEFDTNPVNWWINQK